MTERVVVLLDMDCFYVQVEERDNPHIKGVPAAVVQYNSWKGGGIIAVNYEARAFGVKRGMRGDEARSKCADIQLVQVPVNRGKADLTKYRDAGKEVIKVLCDYSDCVERASIDEAYIELTKTVEERIKKNNGKHITDDLLKSTWAVGYENADTEGQQVMREKGIRDWLSIIFENEEDGPLDANHPHWDNVRLAYAALICEEMRAAVLERTGFKCSAGIAHNKMLGKLSCGLHKPNQQTVLPQDKVPHLWDSMPVGKVRHLGGKLGDSLIEELGCNTMGDLAHLSIKQLLGRYDTKTAHWLFNIGKGVDTEQVTSRQLPKSIGCGKNFQGKEALNTQEKVKKWMRSLADELSERLELDQNANKRRAKTITVGVRLDGDERWSSLSRSCSLPSYQADRITQVALSLIQPTNQASPKDPSWTPAIKNISLSAGKFQDWAGASSGNIQEMFKKASQANVTFTKLPQLVADKSEERCTNADPTRSHTSALNLPNSSEIDTSSGSNPNRKGNPVAEGKEGITLSSNSFFKNFMLRRQQMKTSTENELVMNSASESAKEYEGDDSKEECENEDLDILVNQLEGRNDCYDDGDESSNSSDNDSIYEASTDIDSSLASQSNASQDLFMDYDASADKDTKSSSSIHKSKIKVIRDPSINLESENIQSRNETENVDHNIKTNSHPNESSFMEEAGGAKVSVSELFPDLDNFDESLLPMLPNDLKIEVEKVLTAHKAKSLVKQKKAGLWKYVTSSPSKNYSSASKHTQKAEQGSFTQDRANSVQHVSPDSTKSSLPQNDFQKVSKALLNDDVNQETLSQKKTTAGNHSRVSDDMMECTECGTLISVFDMPEHYDYHVALKLQTDIRQEMRHSGEGSVSKSIKDQGKNLKGKKRGRPSKGDTIGKNSKIQKLDSYFSH